MTSWLTLDLLNVEKILKGATKNKFKTIDFVNPLTILFVWVCVAVLRRPVTNSFCGNIKKGKFGTLYMALRRGNKSLIITIFSLTDDSPGFVVLYKLLFSCVFSYPDLPPLGRGRSGFVINCVFAVLQSRTFQLGS